MEEEDALQESLLNVWESIPNSTQTFYELLLDALRSKNFDSFKNIIEHHSKTQLSILNINYVYPNTEETFLDIASRNGLTEFVEFLLQQGAEPNRVNVPHNRAPIHFATEGKHVNTLAALLKEPTINPNFEAGFQTALHFAVINNDLNCAGLLLEKGASANIPNSMGLTALHLAAIEGQHDMVQLILKKSKQHPNVDTYKDCTGKTTRKVIQENLDISLSEYESEVDVQILKYYLNLNNEKNFLESMELVKTEDLRGAAKMLLKMAAQRGFYNAVIGILKKIKGEQFSIKKAAQISVQRGDHVLLQVLLQVDRAVANDLILSACVVLGIPGKRITDQLTCLKLILKKKANVRCSDSNTPLHYAARTHCEEAVALLLSRSSYIGHRNESNELPIADIPAHVLSQYFDECLQIKNNSIDKYVIKFDYRCLMPHKEDLMERNSRASEMEVFKYIANNDSLKHLLKHPLLSSFLYLKWHSIRYILYANLAFYIIFYCVLNAYILGITYGTRMGNETQTHNATSDSPLGNTLRFTNYIWHQNKLLQTVITIMLLFFIFQEIYQFASCVKRYIRNLRNWLQMTLIIFTVALLNSAGQQVGVIVILLSAWKLVILFSQYPHLSTGIEMFQKVSFNFIRFLLPYFFLIFAFALAFYTLFNDKRHFSNFGLSLFKTVIMLTGEFNINDIPFILHPVWSHIIFIFFVFFIAIVLLNLLNGLAVNNTSEILSKTELVRLISRTRLIAYIEDIAIVDPFGKHCSWCNSRLLRWNPFGFLAKRILLFPRYLNRATITVRCNNLDIHDNKYYICNHITMNCDNRCPGLVMDPDIIKQAKRIISDKYELSDSKKIMIALNKQQEKLIAIENALKNLNLIS